MIIGITGNSGSGKTLICRELVEMAKKGSVPFFAKRNEMGQITFDPVLIDADKIVKEMSIQGTIYFKEIVKEFGEDILLENGEIDKEKLANIIFTNTEKRESLNLLTFKYVVDEIKRKVNLSKSKTVIIDAPLLIESELNKICDVVISVIADENVKIERICKRDNIDENLARARIKSQPKDNFYIKNSNYVIVNNGNSNLKKQVNSIKEILESEIIKSKEIVVIQDRDVKILKFKKLLEYGNILEHAFTLKPLDFGSNDTYKEIKEKADNNYKSVCELLELNSKNIIRPYQTHTNNIKEVSKETRNF